MQDRFRCRAWDKEKKQYIYGVENGLQFWSTAGNLRVMTLAEIADSDKYDLEQCTGSRDCHGDLIYEGDICKNYQRFSEKELNIKGKIVYTEKLGCYSLKQSKTEGVSLIDLFGSKIKIIGNIHEKPELVEN